ncbi:hypothetical protein EVAR_30970_1 [Eumeta japonica]|uniref:Uncharacterized protein n=1 Tax=Eumeta variegata TaxID=151549 RepID=A0A4C1W6E7_EUMVA|nr:hypothetical protein EVAR_30970_1 [Eumeta japonica]
MLLTDWTDHPDQGLEQERSAAHSVRSTQSGSPMRAVLTCGQRSIDVRRAAAGCVRSLSCMERTAACDASRNWRQTRYAACVPAPPRPVLVD